MPDTITTHLPDLFIYGAAAIVWTYLGWRVSRWAVRQGRAAIRRVLIRILTEHQR